MKILFVITTLAALGFSIRGLFNKGRSFWSALAGALLIVIASLGALHAWEELKSIPWTATYLVAAFVGAISIFRQVKPRKQNAETRSPTSRAT
jgi:hypothetical protein